MAKKKQEQEVPEQGGFDLSGDSDREKMYANYFAQQGNQEPEPEPTPESEPEPAPEPEPTETEPEAEVPQEESEETVRETPPDIQEEKTVPEEAMLGERNKRKHEAKLRKEAEGRVTQLESQVQMLLQDNKKLMESQKQPEIDYGYGEPDSEVKAYINKLEQKILNLEQGFASQQQTNEQERIRRLIQDTDDKLSKQGFPWFSKFEPLVAREIDILISDNPDDMWWDTQEGWAKAYKERVFPMVKGMFTAEDKKETVEAKKILKKQAALASSGKPEGKTEEEKKDWTIEDYMALRRKNSILSPE